MSPPPPCYAFNPTSTPESKQGPVSLSLALRKAELLTSSLPAILPAPHRASAWRADVSPHLFIMGIPTVLSPVLSLRDHSARVEQS